MSTPSVSKNLLAVILLGIGLLLAVGEVMTNMASTIQAAFIPVKHPTEYNFPAYGKVLHDSVTESGLVDYEALKKTNALAPCVNELERTSPDKLPSSQAKLAFWINAYNMLTLKNIVDRYPVQTVEDLGQSLSMREFVVGGKTYTIREIDRDVIRPMAKTDSVPAIFLLCSGARGGPPLLSHPITAATLQTDANAAAEHFIHNPRNNMWDDHERTWSISSYFKWNEDVIDAKFNTPFDFVNSYMPANDQIAVGKPGFSYRYIGDYNWWLNDLALKQRGPNEH